MTPDDARPGCFRTLVAGICLISLDYMAELMGKKALPALRVVGVFLAFVGMGVFLVAGLLFFGRYLTSMLGRLFG